jgi:hypothetical protein
VIERRRRWVEPTIGSALMRGVVVAAFGMVGTLAAYD